MLSVGKKDILSVYNFFKANAVKNYNRSNYEESLSNIELCAKIGYYSNFFYKDDELESYLKMIALKILPETLNEIKNGRYILIDTNGSDNHGLTQQYIKAFIQMDVEFAYIYECADLGRIPLILEELKGYNKATTLTFDKQYSSVQQIKIITDFIREYKPEKYFMHIMPWDVVATSVCSILSKATKYNINATDHAFWLGCTFVDYCIEFRDYGATVSVERRGLGIQQLLKVPYYPILNFTEFRGLPKTKENTVKLFSGGAFYKIFGAEDKFFHLVRKLLDENTNLVLFFAGGGNEWRLKRLLRKYNLANRVYLIGNRSDLVEVFYNIDIYLGTYPISGGLMSQYAARSGKPILAYTDPKYATNFVEGFVNHYKNNQITKVNEDDFLNYGRDLSKSEDYRKNEGEKLLDSVISPDAFLEELDYAIKSNRAKRDVGLEKIDYDGFSSLYLEVENKFEHNIQKLVSLKLKFGLVLFPKFLLNALLISFWKLIKRLR
ncbi:hypothetical protein [Sphingobacterium siyangense]|uniref:hypothetical protein n=1 Tax=Sphingobacterium siyangense TaxID=459529 RepID=UPI003DA298A5